MRQFELAKVIPQSETVFKPWLSLLRLNEHVLYAVFSSVFGYAVAGGLASLVLVPLVLFSVLSMSFGFAVNDLSDVELDRSRGKNRNPVAIGALSESGAVMTALLLLLGALVCLTFLPAGSLVTGVVTLVGLYLYSGGVRAKVRAAWDLVFQLAPSGIVLAGYLTVRNFDWVALVLAAMTFLIGAMSQLLQEVRDINCDSKFFRNTAILLGPKRALVLCVAMMSMFLALGATLVVTAGLPWVTLGAAPLLPFLFTPLAECLRGKLGPSEVIQRLRVRGAVIAVVVFVLLASAKVF